MKDHKSLIISVSRRTDIPVFYRDWFFNRLKEGFVQVRNPMNYSQLREISLKRDDVDCFVFWSKNPEPMLERLEELRDYPTIFQYTLNGYGEEFERNLPSIKRRIEIFKALSEKLGPKRVLWRYDPILLSKAISKEFHYEMFERISQELSGYTEKCTISFLDRYKKIEKCLETAGIIEFSESDMMEMAERLSKIGLNNGISLEACAEAFDFSPYGIKSGKCIDDRLINKLFGISVSSEKDKNQREECGCVKSVDIGAYNCCLHHCIYCYANAAKATVIKNRAKHDSTLPILIP